MRQTLNAVALPAETEDLRAQVRDFLAAELASGGFVPHCDNWLGGVDRSFSRRLADRGWLGMTWPRQFGGQERSALDRFVVTEELLAAGAPVAAHWITDRQVGPNLLRFGTDEQKQSLLPAMARAECLFCIGMSEPDSGSDLASVRTRATATAGGWLVKGSKVWTSGAQVADRMLSLVRTSPSDGDRHAGLSQVIIDMHADGVTVRPIHAIDGEPHFNEVVMDDVFVPDDAVLGVIGNGWQQVTAELTFERSGPERLMSTLPLLMLWTDRVRKAGVDDPLVTDGLGRVVSRLWALRQMSLAVAGALAEGESPAVEAAMVKDLGTQLEREIVDVVRLNLHGAVDLHSEDPLCRMVAEAVLHSPAFTLRGGATEILRGIVARGLASS